jgi:hypothetical protein
MKVIDVDNLVAKAKIEAQGMSEPFKANFAILVEWLADKTPEAIIRCKDCKYCKVYDDIPWCDRLTGTFKVGEESFCSFGRKENR